MTPKLRKSEKISYLFLPLRYIILDTAPLSLGLIIGIKLRLYNLRHGFKLG